MNTKTTKGFTWLIVTEKAKEVFVSGCFEVYRLHPDGSESLIEEYEDLTAAQEDGAEFGIEVGRVPVEREWAETHHEIISFVQDDIDRENEESIAHLRHQQMGMGGAWELAYDLTTKFTAKYEDEIWGETADWFDTLEEFYTAHRFVKGKEGEKFMRKCSFTDNGMDEGWYFDSDGTYASTQELADQHARTLGYKDFNDLYEKEGGDEGCNSYYTEWADLDYEFVVNGGILIEIED